MTDEAISSMIVNFYKLHDRESHTIWYVKLYLPEDYYKTIFHKLLNIKSRKYNLCNDYIHIGFVKDSEIDAKISYLNIMRNSHKTILPTINKLHDEFADKHPDLYLSKILTYKGLSCSYPPQYQSILNKTERSNIQAFSI